MLSVLPRIRGWPVHETESEETAMVMAWYGRGGGVEGKEDCPSYSRCRRRDVVVTGIRTIPCRCYRSTFVWADDIVFCSCFV